MAFLINRTAAARIECLHALAQLIVAKFGTYATQFKLKDVKFDRESVNIHSFCTLLRQDDIVGSFCRFKENPLDDAGCSITNGILSDSTKSKEVSNTINAMHALGFVERDGRKVMITSFGVRFAKAKYGTEEMQEIISKAVLKYGPIVGVLTRLKSQYKVGDQFNSNEIEIGYPTTNEIVEYNGSTVELSTGSTTDSITRSRSCALAWLTTAGYIKPANIKPAKSQWAHIAFRDYINREHRMEQIYEIVKFPIFDATEIPLSYNNLTKLNSALRENGQSLVREATMMFEERIKNRRFAILYLLNLAFDNDAEISIDDIMSVMRSKPSTYIVSDDNLEETINNEIEIAYMAGIPYSIHYRGTTCYLHPLKGLNVAELAVGAPQEVINDLKSYTFNG